MNNNAPTATFFVNGRTITLAVDDGVRDAEVNMFSGPSYDSLIGTHPYTTTVQILYNSKAINLSCNRDWFDRIFEKMRTKFTWVMTEEQHKDLKAMAESVTNANVMCQSNGIEPAYQPFHVRRVKL